MAGAFIETLRHLSFATAAWLHRVVLGNASPWHPLDLPFDEMNDMEGVPRDRDVRPSLDEVLALRAEQTSTVSSFISALTDDQLASSTDPVPEPGFPESISFRCERLSWSSSMKSGGTGGTPNAIATLFPESVADPKRRL